jgi:DNA-directed RNA polymerase subunit M/transcription elongation factor TFIIS
MATSFVIACPECGKQVKVSDEHVGKKIKCKGCEHVYPIAMPSAGSKPDAKKGPPPVKPASKGKDAKGSPPPAPPAKKPGKDDDEDANPYTLTVDKDVLPRCPFCAKEMPSMEAIICLNCGYNTRTRLRPEVKAVHQTTFMEKFLWLSPGIGCVLAIIGFIVWDLIFFMNIEGWLAGSIFEEGENTGIYTAGFHPGFFKLYMTLLLCGLAVPIIRIGYKRLVLNNKPPERKIKDE